MVSRLSPFIAAMAALTGVVSLNATGAWALTMQECSAKYKAAQTAGTLNGKTWNQFRKDECGATAAAPAKTPSEKAEAPAPPAKSNVELLAAASMSKMWSNCAALCSARRGK